MKMGERGRKEQGGEDGEKRKKWKDKEGIRRRGKEKKRKERKRNEKERTNSDCFETSEQMEVLQLGEVWQWCVARVSSNI